MNKFYLYIYIFLTIFILILFFQCNIHNILFDHKIPFTIYQTWHTHDLPLKMKECVDNLKLYNPEFEHHLYDDVECRQFIKDNFDNSVLNAYDGLAPGTFKADLWRYCILYENGGIYLDIKYQFMNDIKLLDIVKSGDFFVREKNRNGILLEKPIYTGFMITKPKNSLFLKCIKKICENVENKYYGLEHTEPTGPVLVGNFFTFYQKSHINLVYNEVDGIGYISNMHTNKIILSHYPEYRYEQNKYAKTGYWKDMWINRTIYYE